MKGCPENIANSIFAFARDKTGAEYFFELIQLINLYFPGSGNASQVAPRTFAEFAASVGGSLYTDPLLAFQNLIADDGIRSGTGECDDAYRVTRCLVTYYESAVELLDTPFEAFIVNRRTIENLFDKHFGAYANLIYNMLELSKYCQCNQHKSPPSEDLKHKLNKLFYAIKEDFLRKHQDNNGLRTFLWDTFQYQINRCPRGTAKPYIDRQCATQSQTMYDFFGKTCNTVEPRQMNGGRSRSRSRGKTRKTRKNKRRKTRKNVALDRLY
jgi:hypothetical protein